MRKGAVFLMALAVAVSLASDAGGAAGSPRPAAVRRSRFLAGLVPSSPPLSFYDCSKKPPSICLAPGSPGATCCQGQCVDIEASVAHCGNCNKKCKYGETCCGGRCVDLRTDKKNCGECFVQCSKKCENSVCDYAAAG